MICSLRLAAVAAATLLVESAASPADAGGARANRPAAAGGPSSTYNPTNGLVYVGSLLDGS